MSILSRKALLSVSLFICLCLFNVASAASFFNKKDKHITTSYPFFFHAGSTTSPANQAFQGKSPWEVNPKIFSNNPNKAVYFGYRVKSNWVIEGGYAPKFISQINTLTSSESPTFNNKNKPPTNDSRLDELLSGIADYDLFSVGMAYHFD